nr:hypothetical protein [uncultured Ottowia sp.]
MATPCCWRGRREGRLRALRPSMEDDGPGMSAAQPEAAARRLDLMQKQEQIQGQ